MSDPVEPLIREIKQTFKQRKPVRTGSLIVTMFGDSVVPHGGQVGLGSLIDGCGLFDIGHRVVRTAVYRLVQDGMLVNRANGRRSFYTLTSSGKEEFDRATARIYFEDTSPWDESWCLVFAGQLAKAEREDLRRQLAWLGFGQFSSEVFAHPTPDMDKLQATLKRAGIASRVVVLSGARAALEGRKHLSQMTENAWSLQALAESYAHFIALFEPIGVALAHADQLASADAFLLRTLLVHEYRKVLLRDPGLPVALLPKDWPGHQAFALTAALYRLVVWPAQRYI